MQRKKGQKTAHYVFGVILFGGTADLVQSNESSMTLASRKKGGGAKSMCIRGRTADNGLPPMIRLHACLSSENKSTARHQWVVNCQACFSGHYHAVRAKPPRLIHSSGTAHVAVSDNKEKNGGVIGVENIGCCCWCNQNV